MKVTEAPSNIVGVALGEASFNFVRRDAPPIIAKFALITTDGAPVGFMDMASGWSDKALEAFRVFSEVLEEEALRVLFKVPADGSEKEKVDPAVEPPQF